MALKLKGGNEEQKVSLLTLQAILRPIFLIAPCDVGGPRLSRSSSIHLNLT